MEKERQFTYTSKLQKPCLWNKGENVFGAPSSTNHVIVDVYCHLGRAGTRQGPGVVCVQQLNSELLFSIYLYKRVFKKLAGQNNLFLQEDLLRIYL
jgi:hypothetical protein